MSIPDTPVHAYVKGVDDGARLIPDLRRLAPLYARVVASGEPITLTPEDFEFIFADDTDASDVARRWPVEF
jgi:hypothetical protein